MTLVQRRLKTAALAATAALAVGTVLYLTVPVSAGGIPTDPPMYYSGLLEEDGFLVDGTRNIRVVIWDHATSTDFGNLKCSTQHSNVPVEAGHFRVPLSSSCIGPIHDNPDLWVEVEVDGTAIGRSKAGAVPYAVEAARAMDLHQEAQDFLVPPGTVIAYAGTVIPDGWLLADGSELPRSGDFARLFSVIGTAHGGGDGATTFNLPDYRGMFLRGVDGDRGLDPEASDRVAAATGGNIGNAVGTVQDGATALPVAGIATALAGGHTHSATASTAGAHTHSASTGSAGGHTHTIAYRQTVDRAVESTGFPTPIDGLGTGTLTASTASAGAHTHSVSVNSAGNHTHTITVDAANDHTHTITGGDPETRPTNAYVNYIIKY